MSRYFLVGILKMNKNNRTIRDLDIITQTKVVQRIITAIKTSRTMYNISRPTSKVRLLFSILSKTRVLPQNIKSLH
jgi:hypothetical protein